MKKFALSFLLQLLCFQLAFADVCPDSARSVLRPRPKLLREGGFELAEPKVVPFLFVNSEVPSRFGELPSGKSVARWYAEALPTTQLAGHLRAEGREDLLREYFQIYTMFQNAQGIQTSSDTRLPLTLAYEYRVIFSHKQTRREWPLIIPANDEALPHFDFLEKIKQALRELPTVFLQKVDRITLSPYPAAKPKPLAGSFQTIRTSPKQLLIDLYPPSMQASHSELIYILRHELGHLVAEIHYGSETPDSRWFNAVVADGGDAISDNDETSLAEDFADSFALYLDTLFPTEDFLKAFPNTETRNQLQRLYFHRFQILDEIFEKYK